MSYLQSLAFGFLLPWRALRLILAVPRLALLSALPIAMTIGLYAFGFARLEALGKAWLLAQLAQHGFAAGSWAAAIIVFIFNVILIVGGALTFSIAAAILASPFNDFLAERAEAYTTPGLPPEPRAPLGRKARLILLDAGKSIAVMIASLATILISWVPLLNFFSLFLTFLLVAFQFLTYPQTRRGQGLVQGIRFLLKHWATNAAFGAALLVLFSVPFLGCFVMPLAVVGGTLLFARAQSPVPFRLR